MTEEAHVLSYLYFKASVGSEGIANNIIKRLWTQPFIFRNVQYGDDLFPIWHVPHEKRYGLSSIYRKIVKKDISYWLNLPNNNFLKMIKYYLTIPTIHPLIYIFRLIPVQILRPYITP